MLRVILLCLLIHSIRPVQAQDSLKRCASVEVLQQKLNANPNRKQLFENQLASFNKSLKSGNGLIQSQKSSLDGTVYTIPVVFHIVLSNPNLVTDSEILAQLDTLNRDFGGVNGDSSKIPSWFKPLFGKSAIRFCLAQRTPAGQPSTGIDRVITSKNSFSISTEGVKLKSSGGTDSWDHDQYFNVWICNLSGGILGYSSFPGDQVPDLEGVVIDYRALPGGQYTSYDEGKTLTHETGHFFNLYHIWGDDNGTCTGTDYVDDTPNQSNSSSTCISGVKLDNCTGTGNGIMYQNYMDYTEDKCLVMFTQEQVQRMEATVSTYYPKLITSNACQQVTPKSHDAAIIAITEPQQRLCSNSFSPVITIRNFGADTLTSLVIKAALDNGETKIYNWSGALTYYKTADVTLNNFTVQEGNYRLLVTASSPDSSIDENNSNDSVSVAFQYYNAVDNLSEGFENAQFPSPAWDVVNIDNGVTWRRVANVGATGNASVILASFESNSKSRDELRLPEINLTQVDSAFLSFKVAATSASAINMRSSTPDTLEVLVSTDCGKTYTSVYKKLGTALSSSAFPSDAYYIPASTEWRKDSVNLGSYINKGQIMIAFRGDASPQNNVYLDDINLRKVVINPNLKEKGFLVTPNPVKSMVTIQFYPQPADLKSIGIYSVTGQKVREIQVGQSGSNYYSLDLSSLAPGSYIVSAIFTNRVEQCRIIKVN